MRLWYLICLKLFIDSIIILIDERYDFTYHLEYDSNWEKSISYSGCYKLVDIFKNEKEIKINQLSDAINNYLTRPFEQEEKKLFLQKLRSKDYYINRGMICMIGYHKYYNGDFFFKDFEIIFVFNNKSLEFFKLRSGNSKFNQIIIHSLESPYSDCKIKKSNRFKCANDCNRSNNKLSKYYYHGKELNSNQIIKIKFDDNDNELKDNEIKCLEECKNQGDDCELIFFEKKYGTKEQSNTTILRAYPLISKFDYWIQFIGLISLISNISISHLFIKLIKIIKKRIKINIRIIKIKKYKIKINLKKCLNYFKYFTLSILFFYLFFLIYRMVNEYLNKRDHPIKKEITTTELELKSINLVICIPFRFISNYTIKTLSELENEILKVDLLNQSLNDIYLEYENKKIKINYKLNDKKILFFNEKRCYQIEINPNEYKYQNQLLITKLIIEFKYGKRLNCDVYLLSDNENFNYKTFGIRITYLFMKKEIKRSKSNKINRCNNNKDKKIKNDLINECINRKFIDNNQNLSRLFVIDKDQFTINKWNKLSINYTYYQYSLFKKYLDECNANYFNHLNCYESEYKYSYQIEGLSKNKLSIELYHNVIKEIEEEPSIYKLLMDILNIQSILFGLNIFNLITILFNYDKIKFKYNKLLIYSLCSIGFGYHLYFIFDEIINGDLIYSQHYKLEQTFRIPNFVFCFKYNQSLINSNHKLTYKYLDEMYNQIEIDELMYNITHLNKSNKWAEFNNYDIDIFYFSNQKCFEIKFDLEYELDQFQYNDDYINDVLKLYLNYSFFDSDEVNFFFKIPDTTQMSKINNFIPLGYDVSIELIEIDYDDKFNLIKNPLSIIYGHDEINNADKYINNLINNFKINYNLVTLNLPLNNFLDNLEIEDQLFDQLYLQIQNTTDYNQPSNPNFKRTFINNNFHLNQINYYNQYSLINLIFFKKIIGITNEDNYTKLILNFLNLFSLWFNIGLFDLEMYFDLFLTKIEFIFNCLYKLLITIKCKLFVKLNLF